MAPSRSPAPRLGAQPMALRLALAATALLLLPLQLAAAQEVQDLQSSARRELAQETQTIRVPPGVQVVQPYVPFTAPPNCAQAPNILRYNTNVYRAFKDKMSFVRDYNDDRTPKDQGDDLFYFMIDVCNYIASKSIQVDNVTICCRAVDLYGDLWATQTVWGILAQGNDFTTLKWDRGVNFTKADPKKEAIIISQSPTVYTAAQSLVCSNTDVKQNLSCVFTQNNREGNDISRSSTITSGVDMKITSTFGSKGIFGGTEFTFNLEFGWTWSDSSTTTVSKSEGVSSELKLKAPPGECYGVTATTSSTTVTYQVRQKAALQGPMYMYFSPYTTNPTAGIDYWNRVVNGYKQDGSAPPGGAAGVSALRLFGTPTFTLPNATGGGNFINTPNGPNRVSVGNYNAQDVKNQVFGPYLDGWGPKENVASWLANRRDIISPEDFLILRGDAAYIGTPGDFVKYAVSIGYPIDEYHKSMVDNIWTKVDQVTVTYNSYDGPIQPLDPNSDICKGFDLPTTIG